MRHLIFLLALTTAPALAADPTCPDGQRVTTFMELNRYEDIHSTPSHWSVTIRYGNMRSGSGMPEWELDAIRQSLGLHNISDLIGVPFCMEGYAWKLALNEKAVESLAEQSGTSYMTPTSDKFLDMITDGLVSGQRVELREITEIDQLNLAAQLFTGGFAQRYLRPEVFERLKEQVKTKSAGRLTVQKASREEFAFTSSCLCGTAYLKLVNISTRETHQLFSISELLSIVSLDPGRK